MKTLILSLMMTYEAYPCFFSTKLSTLLRVTTQCIQLILRRNRNESGLGKPLSASWHGDDLKLCFEQCPERQENWPVAWLSASSMLKLLLKSVVNFTIQAS